MPADDTAFFDAFTEALAGDMSALGPWLEDEDAGQSRFAVYRNTGLLARVESLCANHPTVGQIMGEDWLTAVAHLYCGQVAATEPSLIAYGRDFGDWLGSFPEAADYPYLANIARLDRLWLECAFAADGPVLDPAVLAEIATGSRGAAQLVLHPSARMASFADTSPLLWRANRPPATPSGPLVYEERPTAILLCRPEGQVVTHLVSPLAAQIVCQCQAGRPILDIAAEVLAADAKAPFAEALAHLFSLNVFSDTLP